MKKILSLLFLCLFSVGWVWGKTYTITFATNTSDGSTEIGTSTKTSTVISAGTDYVSGFTSSCSKAYYKGKSGVKLGTSSVAGTLEFNIATTYQSNIKKITVKSAKYGSDTGTLTLYNGSTSLKTGITTGTDYTHTFDNATTVSSIKLVTSAKRAYISEIVLETEAGSTETTLPSIAVKTAPTKTTYAEGEKFDPTGMVITKTMSDNSTEDVAYADAASSFTFNPSLTTALTTSDDKVTITVDGKTVDQAITVTDFSPTAGTYNIVPNNAFWGKSTQDGSVTISKNTAFGPVTKYGVAVSMNSGTSTSSYMKSDHSRAYNGYTVTLAAPEGFVLKKIVFTGSTWVAPTASVGTMNSKTWTGAAKNVTFSFSGTSYMSNIAVTYGEITKSTITLATCENGSVGASVTTDVEEGTEVTLSNMPSEGYKLTAYSVYKTGDEATKVTVINGKFTMPAYGVTVSATFEQAKVLQSVAITTAATTTVFWKGETFSADGLVLTATFSTGDEVVTPTSITGYDMTTAGEQTVKVSFTEGAVTKEATYNITVKTIANTAATAYTATEAKNLYDAGKDLNTCVYVKGIVSQMYSTTLPSSGYLNFYVSADGTTTSQQFEFYKTYKASGKTAWTALEDVQVGDEVVGYGKLTYYSSASVYEFDGNTESYVVSLNRPVVLTSIELNTDNVKKLYKIGSDDVFSAEGLVVTAHYNVASNDKTIDLNNVTFSGYNMAVANTYTVTVSYTENEVNKTATYEIQVKPNCENLATITKGTETNGTFSLSVSGEQCTESAVSTTLTAVPAEHYHLAAVTSKNASDATVGTIGEIANNECTISGITENTTITAVFEENAKATATFAKGTEEATGTAPANIEDYVDDEITLPANPFALVHNTFAGWKLGENVYAAGDKVIMPAAGANFVATWSALSKWAYTYTSNVTVGDDKVKVNGASTEYEAKKAGTSSAAGSTTVSVPAGTTALHFHAAAWKDDNVTLAVSKGGTELATFKLAKDNGMSGNGPTYTLANDPEQTEYFMVALENITEATEITFSAKTGTGGTAGKRFGLYGVNAVYPAAITLSPASYDFGEVKQGQNKEYEFEIAPNVFVEGELVASFEGEDAAWFSASAIAENKVTVTFAPTAVKDVVSASLKISATNANVSAALSGKAIPANTPEITLNAEEIDFGSLLQDATVADKTVGVTMAYLDGVNASITGSVFTITPASLTANGNITISANTAAAGEYSETLTVSGTGATSKTVTVKMTVLSKYAYTYTSNVEVGNDIVKIDGESYEAIKKGTGTTSQSTTVTVPKGTQTLHFHAAAWNGENTILVVKQGDTELGSFNLYADAGVKSSSPFTLAGNNYGTAQYFSVNVSAYTADAAADITFTTTASPYRFVLYGVNQEGGPEMTGITVSGTPTKLEYFEGDAFKPAGLTVTANYNVGDDKVLTKDYTFAATEALTAGQTSIDVTATYGKFTSAAYTVNNLVVKAIVVESIKLSGDYQKSFELNETFNHDNLVVTAVKNNKDEYDVTNNVSVSTPDLTTAGTKTVTVTYTIGEITKEATYTISVKAPAGSMNYEKVDFTTIQPYSGLVDNQSAAMVDYSGATFEMAFSKGTGSNAPKYYNSGVSARFYDKNTITITSTDNILAVDLVNLQDKDGNSITGGYTMTGIGTNSVTITFSIIRRLTAITVAYKMAQIGSTGYETLADAFAAVQNAEKIELLACCSGAGIVVPSGSNFTVDFNNHTYTVNTTPLAGSAGTANQCFQLLKNSTIEFKNGKVVADNSAVKMIIQNYANLTLTNMVLDATVGTNNVGYVLSTNNGSTVIDNTNITAKTDGVAFDVCGGWGGYESNAVTVKGSSVIDGKIEVSQYNETATETLTIAGGNFTNAEIVVDEANGGENVTVTKDPTATVTIPVGYTWNENNILVKDWKEVRSGLVNGKFGTMCLKNGVMEVEGAVIYSIESRSSVGINLIEAELPLKAGQPYIFQAEGTSLRVVYNDETEATEAQNDDANGLVGNLTGSNMSIEDYSAENQNYIIYNNHICPASSNYIATGRAYLNLGAVEDKTVEDAAPGRRRVTMGATSTDTTTDIDAVELTDEMQKLMVNGQLYIIRGGKMYNVNGVLVK